MQPDGRSGCAAVRAIGAVLTPGLTAGHGAVGVIGALGAFTVAYGEGRPYRTRWRVMGAVGGVFVGLALAGAAVGSLSTGAGPLAWGRAVVLLMTVVAAFVVEALQWGPPGRFCSC